MVCEDCGEATDWTLDGKCIVGNDIYGRVWLVELASHRKTDLLATNRWLFSGRFSPDGRWITFGSYIAPFQPEAPIAESAWTSLPEAMNWWSPDGTLLYGHSGRDGFACLWAQRLNPITKHPIGAPFAIFHSHSVQRSVGQFFVGRDKIVFNMGERTGNIWMAEWKEGR